MIPKRRRHKPAPTPYRSKSEARVGAGLAETGATYESARFRYPAAPRSYTPDFFLPNGIVIEVKGWFRGSDRAKMLAVKAAHPDVDIRFVLDTPQQWTTKAKTMTNAQWCERNGFPWADKMVPQSWIDEPFNRASAYAIEMSTFPVK